MCLTGPLDYRENALHLGTFPGRKVGKEPPGAPKDPSNCWVRRWKRSTGNPPPS